jgi:hypothetical protein
MRMPLYLSILVGLAARSRLDKLSASVVLCSHGGGVGGGMGAFSAPCSLAGHRQCAWDGRETINSSVGWSTVLRALGGPGGIGANAAASDLQVGLVERAALLLVYISPCCRNKQHLFFAGGAL